jgi:hypothetical protein
MLGVAHTPTLMHRDLRDRGRRLEEDDDVTVFAIEDDRL